MSWQNFKLSEFSCKHCGENKVSHDLIDKLQELRNECDFPFIITSGYRCPKHPVEINKKKYGMHTKGLAVDILASGTQAYEIVANAPSFGFTGIGVSQKGKSRFIHLDMCGEKHDNIRPYIWSY